MGKLSFAVWCALGLSSLARSAGACGGGGVTSSRTEVLADTQRIFISTRAGKTEIVAQIGVPETTANYGVLIPVPTQPVLDENPVSSADLDALDAATAPTIVIQNDDDDGGGCGCVPFAAGSDEGGVPNRVVDVSAPVNIGPVTAVVLSAEDASALGAWLRENGFELPSDAGPTLDAYVGSGQRFIAIRRNEAVATGGATSVGIHYTLPGDHRQISLRFAKLGAAANVTFTVFVAAEGPVGPASPFIGLTLNDLDPLLLRNGDYAGAVGSAVRSHDSRAFVLENAVKASSLPPSVGARLRSLLDESQVITRASAILSVDALEEDAFFSQPRREISGRRLLTMYAPRGDVVSLGALGFVGLGLLRRRRTAAQNRP